MRSSERKGQTMAGPSFLPILQWKKKSLRILLLRLLPENCTVMKKFNILIAFTERITCNVILSAILKGRLRVGFTAKCLRRPSLPLH